MLSWYEMCPHRRAAFFILLAILTMPCLLHLPISICRPADRDHQQPALYHGAHLVALGCSLMLQLRPPSQRLPAPQPASQQLLCSSHPTAPIASPLPLAPLVHVLQVRDTLGLTYDVSFELSLFDRLPSGACTAGAAACGMGLDAPF